MKFLKDWAIMFLSIVCPNWGEEGDRCVHFNQYKAPTLGCDFITYNES